HPRQRLRFLGGDHGRSGPRSVAARSGPRGEGVHQPGDRGVAGYRPRARPREPGFQASGRRLSFDAMSKRKRSPKPDPAAPTDDSGEKADMVHVSSDMLAGSPAVSAAKKSEDAPASSQADSEPEPAPEPGPRATPAEAVEA